MSEFAGNLLQMLMSFRCLEKNSKLQERRQSEECQQVVNRSREAIAETMKNPKTYISHVKTMAVLRSTGPGVHIGE